MIDVIDPYLDHLVLATPDLKHSVAQFWEESGVQPVLGGRHLGRGTMNYLVDLGNRAYLEIIGPDPDADDPADPRPFDIDTRTAPSLCTWGIHPVDLDSAVRDARVQGFDTGDICDLSRRTPQGGLLEFRVTIGAPDTLGGLIPFLIDPGTGETHRPPTDLRLVEFKGRHPDVPAVERALASVGAHLVVHEAEAPGLTAVFEGPNGRFTLS